MESEYTSGTVVVVVTTISFSLVRTIIIHLLPTETTSSPPPATTTIMESINVTSSGFEAADQQPMSRTHQYRKVMKPLLERKRRARINKCLDELKDLMVFALQSEGESITKLEKADVLELTVRHMQKLKAQNALGLTPQATYAGKFKAGYTHCAQEVSRFMTTQVQSVDAGLSTRLLTHLGSCVQSLEAMSNATCVTSTPTSSNQPPIVVAPSPLLTPPEEPEEPQALDLSNKRALRKSSDLEEDDDETLCRKRQMSNDSDSGNSSLGLEPEEKRQRRRDSPQIPAVGPQDDSWRPW